MSHYYDRSNLSRIPDMVKLAQPAAEAYLAFEQEAYAESEILPVRTKELIAVAVAHVTGCPYCIDVHVRKFKSLGGTREEIVQALMVAASTRAGAVLSHGTHALMAYEESERDAEAADLTDKASATAAEGPECFC
ncbi:carboxymuconolactone decarboxylase family protein [Paenibacillus methanolicus]|uniref:AhpD family alkylhydroperoxidase n=1 Tax=Paenibacillus methanolicus TaxID=582686 RepID=A0A5S5C6A6_9BACL|nr:carboxymuconolactone decarboxylase family protein [Paenibacillus methanolicus]TYP74847.1 AhpD family alkylhydroperoxidase [Paenibacillus methanolicus]